MVQKKEDCCGCGTCALVCPTNAISMEPEELGCLYPKIDSSKCIHCHACEKVCAYTKERPEPTGEPKVFAAAAKDRAMLKKSASGGVFAAVAYGILDAGGIVYGCSLETVDGELTPMHIGVETHKDLEKLQGSKYVQSSVGTVFLDIKQYLQQGRIVLFSGTPCQVDALKHYLKNVDTKNLYTMDLICHGVPSKALFQGYLKLLGKQKNGSVSSFSFRDKTHGWGLNACCSVRNSKGYEKAYRIPTGISSYYSLFLESEIYRTSCYTCPYANQNRVGDMTIGDFWCFEREHPEALVENGGLLRVQEGISAVLVNNEHGKYLLSMYGHQMDLYYSELESVSKWNRQLRNPSRHSEIRDILVEAYAAEGYMAIERLFLKRLGLRYPLRIAKNWIKGIIRN